MNELSLPSEEVGVLDRSIQIARQINSAIEVLRPLVYEVYEKELWKGRFSSFGEYVESPEGLNRSQGYASKLRTTEQWRLDNSLSEQDLAGIDYECLYLAIKSGGTPEEILSKARTLNRIELKQERAEHDQHPFEENPDCKVCGLSRFLHP